VSRDGHPLTDKEIEIFNQCARIWASEGFAMGSMKTEPLSQELRTRLVRLGEVFDVSVTFTVEPVSCGSEEPVQQHYVMSVHRKKETP